MTTENAAFIHQLKAGEGLAFKQLYKNVFPACSNLILNNNGTMNDARDVFQESLMILVKNLRKERFELSCSIKTYLYSIMRNLWLKRLGKNNKGGLSLVMDDPSDTEYVIIQEDELEEKHEKEKQLNMVADILKNFKEDCRKILTAFYFKKQSMKEIAAAMDYTNQFIRVKKVRCMDALKKKVKERLNVSVQNRE
ncbi:MAG: sigma-70 family RNA polymerase sigma factor [Bacteroidota bacterium]